MGGGRGSRCLARVRLPPTPIEKRQHSRTEDQAGGTSARGCGAGRRGAGAKAVRCGPALGHVEGPETPQLKRGRL